MIPAILQASPNSGLDLIMKFWNNGISYEGD